MKALQAKSKIPLKPISKSKAKNKSKVLDTKTILHRSTPYATSALHVVRVSGPKAFPFLTSHTKLKKIVPRKVYVCSFFHQKKLIDRVVCFAFKNPHSYTGEDMVEIQCHGSLSIVDQILRLGLKFGLSLAEPGEFTQRAFLNGKISIEQAEAVDTLIRAKSSFFRDNALKILENKASLKLTDVKNQILEILSDFETAIEFPEDLVAEVLTHKQKLYSRYEKKVTLLKTYFQNLFEQFSKGKKIDSGIKVGLLGRPNAGKSTLMNGLLREERVLVSDIQGTTRDYVKEEILLNGVPVILFDTAGLRETNEDLERLGISKTKTLIHSLDILIYLIYSPECLKEYEKLEKPVGVPILFFLSCADKLSTQEKTYLTKLAKEINILFTREVCLLNSEDISLLEKDLSNTISNSFSIDPSQLALLSERQSLVVEKLLTQITHIENLLKQLESEEIVAEEFRLLKNLLDEMGLDYDSDEVFDKLFKKFCIGK
jgi:tRNA modification GTPase